MWKVTFRHFSLTVIFIFVAMLLPAHSFSGNAEKWRRFQESLVWERSYENMMKDVGFILQPQFWLFSKAKDNVKLQNFAASLPTWVVFTGLFISVPLWSICFGWLFVKLDNWLNHFPVLGKRVF